MDATLTRPHRMKVERRLVLEPDRGSEPLVEREWLVTNALGGYASATVAGALTRRYHGVLVAALPAPLGRTVMLNHLWEEAALPDGSVHAFGASETTMALDAPAARHLTAFHLEAGLPVWTFDIGGNELQKRVLMPYAQNTTCVIYRLAADAAPLTLRLRPSCHFRAHEAAVSEPLAAPDAVRTIESGRVELHGPGAFPPLRLACSGARLVAEPQHVAEVLYRIEGHRGYQDQGTLWSPGYLEAAIQPGASVMLVASTEPWASFAGLDAATALEAELTRRDQLLTLARVPEDDVVAAHLVLSADQFIISPATRAAETARARAEGDEARTIIAGYHWFTDWGRDTMISLEGLTLSTRRFREAGYILRTFAHYVRDGLIPNMFPDHSTEGLYHTADASLWFFHAVERYLRATGDTATLDRILPRLRDIVRHHLAGTRFGIGVDPADGLLRQGAAGYQLTWMDAKVDDWVVTPRRGKAVEVNALWYNALCLLERWLRAAGEVTEADALAEHAARARASFNRRFWYAEGQHLYDVIDGENGADAALRPNQIFALALDCPILAEDRWAAVLGAVERELLTPYGLRSLAPSHPDYKPSYFGNLRARDAAYHQGTVWAWLIGPFIDAWLRVSPDERDGARRLLEGFFRHLDEACIGSISEVFDAEASFTLRGCVSQAWSVAEVLRCWIKTA
jgi:predicted glycogen debranching enzyme